mmetsp:Transcript_17207/g.19503  ORF Transcript_17207/g.19503 Transcript_17207/m.19503 type:complete len:391 (+) Transcript_17207:155-1327(+)
MLGAVSTSAFPGRIIGGYFYRKLNLKRCRLRLSNNMNTENGLHEKNYYSHSKPVTTTSTSSCLWRHRLLIKHTQFQGFSTYSTSTINTSSSTNVKENKGKENKNLVFLSSVAFHPSPGKPNPLGEDATFIAEDRQALGVADGVGAWKQVNIDSGKYSRELMRNAKSYFEAQDKCRDPKMAMQLAYQLTKNKGTCTCCIVAIEGETLKTANFGDAGFLVLRPCLKHTDECFSIEKIPTLGSEDVEWTLLYKSFEMQHYFNCPVQMGTGSEDTPQSVADTLILPVRPGDILITATDGLFDNLYVNDIKTIIAKEPFLTSQDTDIRTCLEEWIHRVTEKIGAGAIATALSSVQRTPFSVQAKRAGLSYTGGKMDDITIITSFILESSYLVDDK